MSNFGLEFGPDDEGAQQPAPDVPAEQVQLPRAGSRRAEPASSGRFRSCLPLLLALVLICVGAYFGGGWVIDKIKSLTGDSPDYSNSSLVIDKAHAVVVEVHSGDNASAIGRTLKAAGVVKSVDAYVEASSADDRSLGIQVGFYALNKEMKASAALAILINHDNLIQNSITIPEGFRVDQIIKRIVDKTDFTKAQIKAAMRKPAALGLPAEAKGDYEGYLFPATYTVLPGATPTSVLKTMIDKTKQVESDLDVVAKAKALNLTPHEVLTVASILEYEASRDQDYPKVARAIYNRLKIGMALQSDATVAFANNLSGTLYTNDDQRAIDSPYNTYKYPGLPPGPIGAAGEKTIKAALNPTPGPWLYWVVVNLKTGETRFNTTFAGHQQDVAEFHRYCQTSDAC